MISKNHYNSSKKLVNKSKFENELNKKGKLYRQTEFNAWEKSLSDSSKVRYQFFPEEIIEFLYDNKGKLSKQKLCQSSLSSFQHVIEYQNGRMYQGTTVDLMDNSIWSSTEYECLKFDSNNNCIKYKDADVKMEYYN